MFGGKTEHLIACLRRAESRGLRVAAFKHCIVDAMTNALADVIASKMTKLGPLAK